MNAGTSAVMFEATPSDGNLNGFRPCPDALVVEWARFFDVPGQAAPQPSRRIDALLAGPLFDLPESVVPPADDPAARVGSLAERNLLRGKRLG